MTYRPCKPDADLQGIWQMLLPEVPFPACGLPNAEHATRSKSKTSGDRQINPHNEQARCGAAGAPQPPHELI
jgi:hypothetical protein